MASNENKAGVVAAGGSVKGNRKRNEDAYKICSDTGLFIVADGMGGHKGGDVASHLACDVFARIFFEELKASVDEGGGGGRIGAVEGVLRRSISATSRAVYQEAQKDPERLQNMGTTLVSLYVDYPWAYVAYVGDSRAYLRTAGRDFTCLTIDHNFANEMFAASGGREEESTFPGWENHNVITRSVGYGEEVLCDVMCRKLCGGERFLLCSDGLNGYVKEQVIEDIIQNTPHPEEAIRLCLDASEQAGGHDNTTVIVVDY